MINWDAVQEAYERMIKNNEQIFVTLKSVRPWREGEEEYYIWNCDVDSKSEGGEIWLAPIEYGIEGSLNEMIVHDDYSITLASDFEEDVTERIASLILDPDQHVKVKWIENCEPRTDEFHCPGEKRDPNIDYNCYFAKLVIEGQEHTIKDWTGRYFEFNDETKEYEVKEGEK